MDFSLNQSTKMNIKPVKYEHVTTFGVAQPVFLVLGGGGTCEGTCWNWSSVRGLSPCFRLLRPHVATKCATNNQVVVEKCCWFCTSAMFILLSSSFTFATTCCSCLGNGQVSALWRQKRCHSVPNSLRSNGTVLTVVISGISRVTTHLLTGLNRQI